MRIVKNISAREPRYNSQEALERIWNNAGDEEDFEFDESKVESYETVSEDESEESSVNVSSLSEENIAQDSEESSNDVASNAGMVGIE